MTLELLHRFEELERTTPYLLVAELARLYVRILRGHEARVEEAHALGALGPDGGEAARHALEARVRDLNALAEAGGVLAGYRRIADSLAHALDLAKASGDGRAVVALADIRRLEEETASFRVAPFGKSPDDATRVLN